MSLVDQLRSRSSRARARVIAGAVATGVFAGTTAVALLAGDVGAADVVYVAPDGDDAADGSSATPVRTITQAVRIAGNGATVMIAGGVYHESVQVYAKEIHLDAEPGADVVLDGARTVDGWTQVDDGWAAPWTSDFDRVGAPFTTPEHPEAGWPEQFFVDGTVLDEVATRADLTTGTFFHDREADLVVVADDPNGRIVEGSDLSWGLYLNGAHGSSVTGLTVRRFATQNRHMAAVRAYADDLVIRDVTVADNARIGLSAIGERIVVEQVTALDNGHLGLHGHHATDLTMRDLEVRGNNREEFDAKHSAGGIKITTSERVLVERAEVADNGGPGIWTDLDVIDATIRSSVVERNLRSGIEVELSERVVVVDNIVADNGEAGVWVLESSDVEVWHNTALRNVRDVWVEDGDRADLVGVTVTNNVLGGGADGAQAVLNVDDWTEERSAADMQVATSGNRFWLRPESSTQLISRWANWPAPLSLSADIDEHRAATSHGVGSDMIVASTYPFGRGADDVRQPETAIPGMAPNALIATVLGDATARPAGALTVLGGDGGDAGDAGDVGDGGDGDDGVDGGDGTSGDRVVTPPPADDDPGTDAGVDTTIRRRVPTSGSQGVPTDLENAEIGRSGQLVPALQPSSQTSQTSQTSQRWPITAAPIATPSSGPESAAPTGPVADRPAQPVAAGGWGVLRTHVRSAVGAAAGG